MAKGKGYTRETRVEKLMKQGKTGMQTIRREGLPVSKAQDRKIRRTLQER